MPISAVLCAARVPLLRKDHNGQQQRDAGKRSNQSRHHTFLAQRPIEDVTEELRAFDNKLVVDFPHRVANRRDK
jgi:hypothetical protein